MSDLAQNRALADAFVTAWNGRDMAEQFGLQRPHRRVVMIGDGDVPAKLGVKQPIEGAGMNLNWPKSIFDKAETLAIFSSIFAATRQFTIAPKSFTSQDDRIVVELVGDALNEANGRRYANLYCYLLQVRDGQIVLFREYQDTLLLFDVWVVA
ncbi:MAG TPA: hypothetical protein VHY34_10490 [Caulobacteraceae bacterium]|jgi:ketosteroid isomerase-like protein|nr:hypothetical protein [Caulobacteraceae bacterium]